MKPGEDEMGTINTTFVAREEKCREVTNQHRLEPNIAFSLRIRPHNFLTFFP